MKIFIKNMVSLRCKLIVKTELDKLGLSYLHVILGEVELTGDPSDKKLDKLRSALQTSGLELMEDKKSILIEKIKNLIVEMVHYREDAIKTNFSDYIAEKLGYDYRYLSGLFSEVKGTTIEHYIIAHKIERAKELLVYENLTLTQIADMMHYSSVAHLSYQFKKVTGLTPSFFKKMKEKRFIEHENI